MHARSGAMADRIWDLAVPLSTAPIFDDAVYLSEALGLPVAHAEDDVDADLALQARESGILDPYRFLPPPRSVSRAMSTMTLDSDQASATSIRSQETHSTSFTSAPSRTSRDHVYSTDHPSAKRAPPTPSHAPQSLDTAHPPIERLDPAAPATKSPALSSRSSVLSVTPSSQQKQSRKKRGSAIFSKLRRESRYFATVSLHARVAKTCSGSHVASQSNDHVAAVEGGHVETSAPRAAVGEKTDFVTESAVQASDVALQRNPGSCKPGVLLPSEPLLSAKSPLGSETSSTVSSVPARHSTHEPISTDPALAKAAFKSFKLQQREQWDQVSAFECMQRKALASHYENQLKRLKTQYEARKSERIKQHADDLDLLEERQLLAEHDLLQTQAQETQNVATALKYIEAYCLGPESQHERTVSKEDFKKLERQRLLQQGLPRKHGSAINVLRARQEMDFKRRLETQEAELTQMDVDFEKEEATKEAECKKELEQLEAVIEARRRRLQQRWELKFEMWRRDWEQQHNTTLDDHLEHEEWPPRQSHHVVVIPEASALAQYVKITA